MARASMLRHSASGASRDAEDPEPETQVRAKYYRSWHLAGDESSFKVTEFEWTMIRFYEAFSRCVSTIGALTVDADIKFSEHLILHVIRMQDRPKNSTTIARMINRDDIPNIQYSLRKLEAANLIEKTKETSGKTFAYAVTELGARVTDEYAAIRSEVLLENLGTIGSFDAQITKMTQLLGVMTGIYEEAARNSATFSKDD
jgi:predicted MarR family transcription regulator